MNQVLKYILIALAALLLVAVAVGFYIAASFDPNTFKPKIIQLVKEKTQRTLAIPGDIRLSFFPKIGLSLGGVTLSEFGADQAFASVDELRLSLGLIPLLQKQLQVDDAYVKGLKATLVRDPSGRLNIDDLLGAKPGGAPGGTPGQTVALPAFAVSSLHVDNGVITFRDEKAKATYALSDLDLKTGRIANDTPSTLDLSAQLRATAPQLDLATQLKSELTFNLDRKHFSLKDIVLDAKGDAAGISNLSAKLRGSVDAVMTTPAIDASKLEFAATGSRDKYQFEVDLALPRLGITREKVEGEHLGLRAVIRGATGNTTSVNLTAPRLEGSAEAFKILDIAFDIDATRPDQTLKAHLTGPAEGRLGSNSLKPAQVSVNPLGVQATLSGPFVPNKSVTGDLKGSAAVDLEKQRGEADLMGTFDESTIKAKIGVMGFSPPGYSFDLDIDKLDLTRYQPQKPSSASAPAPAPASAPAPAAAGKPGPEPPLDFSALKELNANGSIRIGSLKAPKIKATNVRIEVRARDGRVNIDPLAADLYGGSLNGAIDVDAQGTPRIAVRQKLADVNITPLLTDVANFERLEGRGNFSLNVTTAGQSVTELRKALSGSAAANLADGAIRGVNIAATIRDAKATLSPLKGQLQTAAADVNQKTVFSELKATFNIRNGVASSRDLVMTSPALRVVGEGDIDLGTERMNYLLKAQLNDTGTARIAGVRVDLASITIPVRVTGPLDAPTYQFDFGGLAASVAQQVLEEQIQKKLGGKLPEGTGGDLLQDAVKGLFRR